MIDRIRRRIRRTRTALGLLGCVLGWIWLLCCLPGATALAHEVRPAYLQITESADHGYHVLWKQPVMGEVAVHLVPHLSSGDLESPPLTRELNAAYAIETWSIPAGAAGALERQSVSIDGLDNTITDVLVLIRRADGSTWQTILTPGHPSQLLGAEAPARGAPAFLTLGIEHILTGVDHLLFVFGLLLLVQSRSMLLKTVTAFTVAHSITLAIATLGHAHARVPLVNALIAASILFLAPEIVRRWRGGTSLTIRHPWVVAFAFGLLHGFGFAGGLGALDLPPAQLPKALLLFNIGVEIGQLSFVALILWLERAFRILAIRWPILLQRLPAYVIGASGALWTLQRILVLWDGKS